MAVTPDLLLEPTGELTLELFPGKSVDDVNAILTAYIADGYTRAPATLASADRDAAVIAWSYARAYRAVWMRLSRTAAAISLANEGSSTMTGEQIRTWEKLANRWQGEFDTVVGDAPLPDDTPSAAATNTYVW